VRIAHTRAQIQTSPNTRATMEDRKAEIVPVCRIRYMEDRVRSCVKRGFQFDQQSTQTVVTNGLRQGVAIKFRKYALV